MEHLKKEHYLDYAGHYRLTFHYEPESRTLIGTLGGPVGSTKRVEKHLTDMLTVEIAGQEYHLKPGDPPSLRVAVPEGSERGFDVNLYLTGNKNDRALFGYLHVTPSAIDQHETLQRLTVFETRMMGNDVCDNGVPYDRKNLVPVAQQTDLHTHLSGQISAQGLIDVTIQHHIPYPTALLKSLGINCSGYPTQKVEHIFFPPTDAGRNVDPMEDAISLDLLPEKELAKLRAALAIPPDRQMTFGNLETTVYRYRTPITKAANPKAAYDILLKTAKEYQRQDITYAEITATSTSLLTPDYMAFLHKNLPKIEKETGVKLRFLAGIPRNFSDVQLTHEVKKITIMGASPYIVGVDFMGFEDNKITKLGKYIETLSEWAHANDPGFTLRIHAGENRKNMDNVKESLQLADRYNMRVRIGHAAHGLDDEAITLAKKLAATPERIMIEFNPDSNMALNNIDHAEDLNIVRCSKEKIPFVACSDGGGLYQTTAQQTGNAAIFAAAAFPDVGGKELAKHIRQSEEAHIAFEKKRFDKKLGELPDNFLDDIRKQYAALPKVPSTPSSAASEDTLAVSLREKGINVVSSETIQPILGYKKPLMILGARGQENWEHVNRAEQQKIEEGIGKLLEQLDPRKVYFMIGRPKDTGVAQILIDAVHTYNEAHHDGEKFSLVSTTVQAEKTIDSFVSGITHVLPLQGGLFTVPNQLVDTVQEQEGHIIFIGGGTFTRDAILIARDQQASFGLMVGPEGASTDKAPMMKPEHHFTGADGLVNHLRQAQPSWFRIQHRPPHTSEVGNVRQ